MENYLTVREFLDRYAIGRTTFYRAVNNGALRLTKIGRATRISEADAKIWASNLPTRGGAAHG